MSVIVPAEPTTNTIIQEKINTTIVLMAVATSESVFFIPHFARIDVKPANIAEKIAVRCNATNLFDYIQISNQYSIFEVKVKKSWVGRSIKELDIRNKYDVNIIAVRNAEKVKIPTADYIFLDDDRIYLFGKDTTIKKLKN